MNGERVTPAMVGAVTLLERALAYTCGSLQLVSPQALRRPTPCRGWTLAGLLDHMVDSLSALHEALTGGRVNLAPNPPSRPAGGGDPVVVLRRLGGDLLGASVHHDGRRGVSIGGSPVTSALITGAGALEIAVHGWDVAQACGQPRPLPASLADELLDLAGVLVSADDRPHRFGPAIGVPGWRSAEDRLVGYLGRYPEPGTAAAA